MSKKSAAGAATAEETIRGGRAYYVLIALVLGLVAGAAAASLGDGLREPALQVSNMVGGLWLNALKMTVIPLIIALLVTGIAKGAEAARAGRIAGRSVLWIVIVCTSSAIFGTLMIQFLLGMFPLPEAAGEALRAGLTGIDPATAKRPRPRRLRFLRNVIPTM